jgi:glycosyltransferase involved in cell wall biosynthesis
MAAGAVPVLSRLDCYRDMLREGVNGFTFDHTALAADAGLADVLGRLIRDASLRRALSARAQADARRFDYGVVARALLEDFAQLTR